LGVARAETALRRGFRDDVGHRPSSRRRGRRRCTATPALRTDLQKLRQPAWTTRRGGPPITATCLRFYNRVHRAHRRHLASPAGRAGGAPSPAPRAARACLPNASACCPPPMPLLTTAVRRANPTPMACLRLRPATTTLHALLEADGEYRANVEGHRGAGSDPGPRPPWTRWTATPTVEKFSKVITPDRGSGPRREDLPP